MNLAWIKVSGPERASLPPDGSYTDAFREASMSSQTTAARTNLQDRQQPTPDDDAFGR